MLYEVITLNSSGLQATGFEKPSAFWKAIDTSVPSLILLDLMLPEEDGLHILKKLRRITSYNVCYTKLLRVPYNSYFLIRSLVFFSSSFCSFTNQSRNCMVRKSFASYAVA